MLIKRIGVALALLPIGLGAIVAGGWVYSSFIALVLALAAWEYVQLFRIGGLQPAGIFVLAGVILLVLGRTRSNFANGAWEVSLLVLAAMAIHLVRYEQGRDQAATDMGVTMMGIMYFGWIGAYMVSLRNLPDGMWWTLVALPAVWATDSGAYVFGKSLGRHHISPRSSPNKTWEGYLGGALTGAAFGALLAWAFQAWAGAEMTSMEGGVLGLVLGLLTLLGDLGESMIKRQVGAKDSGNLLPGHGGAFDRIDSWLWAGVLSFYIIIVFFG